MTTIPFNTHTAIKRLIKLGYKEPHAEEFVKIFQEGKEIDTGKLATKADLEKFVTKDYFDAKLTSMATKEDVANVKYDILKWILPFLLGIIIAIFIK